jgi:hypothetical protein
LQPDLPTQAPTIADGDERDETAPSPARARVVRLLLAWAVAAAGLFLLRGPLEDPYWRVLLLPFAFVAVVVLGVLTVRLARVRIGVRRRRAERRAGDRRRGAAKGK